MVPRYCFLSNKDEITVCIDGCLSLDDRIGCCAASTESGELSELPDSDLKLEFNHDLQEQLSWEAENTCKCVNSCRSTTPGKNTVWAIK